MKVLRFCLIIILISSLLLLIGCQTEEVDDGSKILQKISITGGSEAGDLYLYATIMSDIITNQVDWIDASPETSGGGVENSRLIGTKQTDFAFSGVFYESYNGIKMFEEEGAYNNTRGIFGYDFGESQVVTLASSGIKFVKELEGKRISLGSPGSVGAEEAEYILKFHGVQNYDAHYLTFAAAADALKDGAIDVLFVSGRAPTATIMEIAASREIRLLQMDEEALEKMFKEFPRIATGTIAPNVYGDAQVNEEPIKTYVTIVMFATHEDVDEDLVYEVTKAFWENINTFHAANDKCKFVTLEEALKGMTIPLHPGAEKYYKEIGLL